HKPELRERDGQKCPDELTRGKRFAFIGGEMQLAGPRFQFRKHGDCGLELSELLPHLGSVADELCVIKSRQTNEINHAPAQMFLHSGFGRGGRPSLGAWVNYGLGSENDDLPAYVVLLSGPPGGAGTVVHRFLTERSSGDSVSIERRAGTVSRQPRRAFTRRSPASARRRAVAQSHSTG
ncbi:MAG: hypothetical protein FD138_575, partial [Planctomycetota bacterium]